MLKTDEDVFLDDFTVRQVSDALQVPIDIVKSSGQDFIGAAYGYAPADVDNGVNNGKNCCTLQ